jgi:outer membrane protein assembly factor BamB
MRLRVLKRFWVIWGLSFFVLAFGGGAQDWLGFHGLDRQGVCSETPGPIDWSGQINTSWKTSVPGFGYSTPVVAHDKVYLTTAYETQKGKHIRRGLAYLNPIFCWVLVAVAAVILGIRAAATQAEGARISLLEVFRLFLVMSAGLLTMAFCVFADKFFGHGSSTIRAWKFGTAAAFISLLMIPFLMPRSKGASILFAILATLLGAGAYFCLPQRELFLDFDTPGGVTCTFVILMPGLAGWMAYIALRWANAPTNLPLSPAPSLSRVAIRCGLTALFIFSLFWALKWRADSLATPILWNAPDEPSTNIGFSPVLGWPFVLGAGLLTILIVVVGARFLSKSHLARRRLALCGATATLLLGLGCFLYFSVFPVKREMAHVVVCLDRNTGAVLWLREAGYSATITDLKGVNSHATPTVAVGTTGICAYFGSAGLYGLDTTGKVLWQVTDTQFDSPYGIGHSPVIADDVVILANDNEKHPHVQTFRSHINAYSLKDGRLLWRKEREPPQRRSAGFNTPIVRTIKGRKTVLVRGWDDLTAYDLHTGEIQWTCQLKHRSSVLVASLVSDEKYIYVLDGAGVRALDLDAPAERRGGAWLVPAPGEKVASPVLVDGLLFFATDTGMAFCVDIDKRSVVWREKLGGRFFSSALAQGNHIIFADESGKVSIVERSRAFKLVAQVDMGEKVYATPVPQADGLLIRGATNLFYLRAKQQVSNSAMTKI